MTESEAGGIVGILRFLKDARTVLKEADSFADDAEEIISKHKNAITEVFGEFLPEIGSRVDSVVQTVSELKPVEEELLFDVLIENNTIQVIVSTFTTQPEVELNEDTKSITIHYGGNKTKLISLPCAVDYKDKYLFTWNDSDKEVIDVLKGEFNIDWLDEVKVKTTDKIKYIFKGKEHKLSVLIDETDKNKATMSVDNERVFNLKLERDNGKIKVYRDSYTFVNGVLNLLFAKKKSENI